MEESSKRELEMLLEKVKKSFLKNGMEVVGGIATVPGGDFGVKQKGKLGWFNWQNPKTQNDLKEVMQMSAEVFDEFIVDDFLCTADTSDESKVAKGSTSWSQYRRDLLSRLSKEIFMDPAKEVNPKIIMIIKYPQWYDRFHLFGMILLVNHNFSIKSGSEQNQEDNTRKDMALSSHMRDLLIIAG